MSTVYTINNEGTVTSYEKKILGITVKAREDGRSTWLGLDLALTFTKFSLFLGYPILTAVIVWEVTYLSAK